MTYLPGIARENEAAAHKVLARIEARVPILRGEKLADLPDSILLDIGVAEEEIPRIRSRERFTPRSWSDYRGSLRHYAG